MISSQKYDPGQDSAAAELCRSMAGQAGCESGLPEPPPFWSRQVFGPSAVFTAMAVGSGELLFWPSIALVNGAGVLWIAILVVGLQYVVNIEIGRYSLAKGESVVVGAVNLWRGWAPLLLAGAVVPWLWPGWARAGCQLLGGVLDLPERPLSIASLVVCGLLLAVPARVYGLLERLQTILLVVIFVGIIALCTLVIVTNDSGAFWSMFVTGDGLRELAGRSIEVQNLDFLTLLGGIVFAGGGGILNLGYGLLLCEKGFGMGTYATPIGGLRHSFGLIRTNDDAAPTLGADETTRSRWRRWMGICRREHAILFIGGNVFTIVFISLMLCTLLGPSFDGKGMTVLFATTESLGNLGGCVASALFTAVAVAIFFTSEIGIIDMTSRIAAGIVHSAIGPSRLSATALYHTFVWLEIIVGAGLILTDPRQPFWFIVTSGIINTLVMAVYTALIARLNSRELPPLAKPNSVLVAVLWCASFVYAGLFILTLSRL